MTDPIYIQLGDAAHKIPGFINADASPGADVPLDLNRELPWTQLLPWGQGTVEGIFSENFIERLSQAQGISLLRECRRILKPGGVLRIATLDLPTIVADYRRGGGREEWTALGFDWIVTPCEQLNLAVRGEGRQWLYDENELARIGRMVGLGFAGRRSAGESADPLLQGRERNPQSRLVLEFRKPDRRLKPDERPLVTIAIPGYNPRYFSQALESAIAQTYPNLEILVCDDCPTNAVEEIIKPYAAADARIRYLPNPPEVARKDYGRENYLQCLRHASADFIKFLNDDDLLAPTCVERMMTCFMLADDITLVTSKRQQIDAAGNHLADLPATTSPVEQDSIIEGLAMGAQALLSGRNLIGEPTTALFRKSELADIVPDPLSMDGKPLTGVCDLAMWLHLATKGNVVYLVEPLSYFRRHGEQIQVTERSAIRDLAQEGWGVIKRSWHRRGLVKFPVAPD